MAEKKNVMVKGGKKQQKINLFDVFSYQIVPVLDYKFLKRRHAHPSLCTSLMPTAIYCL